MPLIVSLIDHLRNLLILQACGPDSDIIEIPGMSIKDLANQAEKFDATVLTQDALGHGPVGRTITAVAGQVEHGNSGGPAVDAAGRVESTIFAARLGSASGYGVPPSIVRSDLARAGTNPVPTGSCAP